MGSVWLDLFDHVIVTNERHLRRLLREYLDYYNSDRWHLALAKYTPSARLVEHPRRSSASVVAKLHIRGFRLR